MASSKLPVDFVLVSQSLIDFAKANLRVHCNIRPWQLNPKCRLMFDSEVMDPGVMKYLKHFAQPGDRILLHFQGYGKKDIGTAVVELTGILWADQPPWQYPRLDFKHPAEMEDINGCPNFWGAFILAIAWVPAEAPLMCSRDADATTFMRLAAELTASKATTASLPHP